MEGKILIVDDEKTVIEQVKTLIDSFGYKSFYIPRAQFLIKRLETDNFDLILMDINMPGIDGITALKTLKSNPLYREIPVIMMTGDTDEKTLELCFNQGADDYITKPISELVLKARVRSVIDKQQYLREITTKNHELSLSEQTIKVAHNNITASINYAKTIQAAVMPSFKTLNELFPSNFVFFKPRDVVSGDFYWTKVVGNYTLLVAADCTGHGVPGAFLSILGISLLNEISHTLQDVPVIKPSEILEDLRIKVKQALGQTDQNVERKDGMDIAITAINKQENIAQFAGAHNSAYIIRSKENPDHALQAMYQCMENHDNILIEIKADYQPIGVYIREHPFKNQYLKIRKNDKIYLCTDGFSDQVGQEKGLKYMRRNFKGLLLRITSKDMQTQLNMLNEEIQSWMGNQKQIDDMLILGITI